MEIHKALGNVIFLGMGRMDSDCVIGKGRRTQRRRVNGKAGVGLSLPHTRVVGNE